MDLEPWVYAALFAFALLQLVVVAVATRHRGSGGNETGDGAAADGRVECASCGTENRTEYRFCRRCVTELPGGIEGLGGRRSPAGRGIV